MLRCGIALAAGEGRRLQPFIHRLRGDALPKQYVRFHGRRSMLEQTISRAERLIPPDRLFIVVGRGHLEFREAAGQLAARPPGTVILQPANKETGPGILLPLMHLVARHPDSVAVIFPSDHYIAEAELFMDHVDLACRAVERDPNQLILLGVEPHAAEPEYGYILPGRRATDDAGAGVKRVARFFEKPHPADAERLIRAGALWNTFVMVARPASLLDLVRRLAPWLYHDFLKIQRVIGTGREQAVTEEVYQTLAPVNFSKGLLERVTPDHPLQVSVIPVRGVWWSDWGSEQRLVAGLEKTGCTDWDNGCRPPLGGIMTGETPKWY
ncbi:MAG: NTP transferase domain-containing protein [Nitrospirae bacterium]|nr:NTP transferase domain-containing protein [Nitrospirota bacterium]